MKLVDLEEQDGKLFIRRLNTSFVADVKSALLFWLASLLYFAVIGGAGYLVTLWVIHIDGHSPIPPLITIRVFLFIVGGTAFAFLTSLIPSFQAILPPKTFLLDVYANTLLANGKNVGCLKSAHPILQDSFGPGPRALRLIILSELGNIFVVAQTQRYRTNYGTLSKEYQSADPQEHRQNRYWYGQWADYSGVQTGFNPGWPEYHEVLALYTNIKNYIEGRIS